MCMGKAQRRKCLYCEKPLPVGRDRYCSDNCIKKAWKKRNPEKVREQELKDNKKWKLYQKNYESKHPGEIRKIKRKSHVAKNFGGNDLLPGASCHFCGKGIGLGIHHKDMNRDNNALENLVVLCVSCHTKLHSLIRKVTGHGINAKK